MKPGIIPLESEPVQIHVIYDTIVFDPSFKSGVGFACYVVGSTNILFDTGCDALALRENLKTARLPEPDLVVLSHDHADHTDGIDAVLRPGLKVFVPAATSDATVARIEKSGATVLKVSDPKKLTPTMATTGELEGERHEQALLVSTQKGIIVITGCAHPGIGALVRRAKEVTGKSIYLVLGGFHLYRSDEKTITSIVRDLKELGVEKVAPSHCTGERARSILHDGFGKDFVESGAGRIVEIR